MQGLHALRATELFATLPDDYHKETMLSAGGKMVGKVWSKIPRSSSNWIDNDHFRMGLLLRLGEVRPPQGAMCQITAANGEQCLRQMDSTCVHPLLCKKGPARLRPHRAIMLAVK
eukprot:5618793-Karenia_brevis.AAC.1